MTALIVGSSIVWIVATSQEITGTCAQKKKMVKSKSKHLSESAFFFFLDPFRAGELHPDTRTRHSSLSIAVLGCWDAVCCVSAEQLL